MSVPRAIRGGGLFCAGGPSSIVHQTVSRIKNCFPFTDVYNITCGRAFRSARTSFRAFDPIRPSCPQQFSFFFSSFSLSFFSSFCPVTPGHPCHPGCCCCSSGSSRSSGWASLLQLIIWIGRPFANDHPDGPALLK